MESYYTMLNITVSFGWDLPQGSGPEAIVDYYVMSIMPEPLSHPVMNTVNSRSLSITMEYNTMYRTGLIAVNCAGDSGPFELTLPGFSK